MLNQKIIWGAACGIEKEVARAIKAEKIATCTVAGFRGNMLSMYRGRGMREERGK